MYYQDRPSSYVHIFPWENSTNPETSSCLLVPQYKNNSGWLLVDTKCNYLQWKNRTARTTQDTSQGPFQPLTRATLAGTLITWESENSPGAVAHTCNPSTLGG